MKHCRQYTLDLLWPWAYQRERPVADKDNSLTDLTPALAGPPIAPDECKYRGDSRRCNNALGFRLEIWGSDMTTQCDRTHVWERGEESGSEKGKRGTEKMREVMDGGGSALGGIEREREREGGEDDRHRLLFTSLPIYTLTQTESISQSPDILPTPFCEGTSPWQSLVGVGGGTNTHTHTHTQTDTECRRDDRRPALLRLPQIDI